MLEPRRNVAGSFLFQYYRRIVLVLEVSMAGQNSTFDQAKYDAIREIEAACAYAFDELLKIHKHIIMSRTVRADATTGESALLLTLDMVRVAHRDKKIAKERYKVFFACVEFIHDTFADLAPRRQLAPFYFEIKDNTGKVLVSLDLPVSANP